MSAYVVDDITINRILGYLEYGKHAPHYIRKRLLTTVNQSYEELGKAMYRLNCRSVDERYGEKAEDMYGDEYVYRLDVFCRYDPGVQVSSMLPVPVMRGKL